MPKVISGFPGVGKSTLFNKGLKCTDSDSSKFDKEYFPANYITHIKELLKDESLDYIFVSSHDTVRRALVEHGIPYTLVYPAITIKDEYIERYKKRGSPEAFINLMDRRWTNFIVDCSEQPMCKRIVLQEGQYLEDVLDSI